jgi:hypothetical protein
MSCVGRIGKDQSKRCIERLQKPESVILDYLSVEPGLRQIETNCFDRFGIIVDKHGFGGSSTQSFNPKCAASREKIEHPSADYEIA